jgi:hypothetical protein
MTALTRCLGAAGLGAMVFLSLPAAVLAADTSADASCTPLGYVQKRVVQKAEVGVDALRDYVYITQGVHQLSLLEIAASLDAWLASAHCSGLVVDEQAVRQNVALAVMTTNR